MKKLFLLLLVAASFAAQAQTVTQKDLQGKWKLVTFINENGTVDIAKGTWKLNAGAEDAKDNAAELYEGIIAQSKDAVLVIKGDTASQVVEGQEFETQYSLEDKNGKTYITMDQGTTGAPQVFIKDGQMHVLDENHELDMEMIYSPVK